jgi:2-dehydropantoate 2-reductase
MHTGAGNTQLGAFNQAGKRCKFLTDVLAHALPEVSWNDIITHALWNKLAINCAINPLSAIHQVKNGQLADSRFQQTLEQITAEVAMVMQAEGIDIQTGKLLQLVYTVIEATAANQSSMQQDIAHQRRSEIDYITGYLCRCAEQHQLAVPANLALYKQIKQIEQSWQ